MNGYFACVPQTSGTGCSDSSRRLLRYQLCSTSLIAANCALWKIIDISVNNRTPQYNSSEAQKTLFLLYEKATGYEIFL